MAIQIVVSRMYGENEIFINLVELPRECKDGSVYEKMLTPSRNPSQGRTIQLCRVSGEDHPLMIALCRHDHPVLHRDDAVGLGRQFVVVGHDDERGPTGAVQLTK